MPSKKKKYNARFPAGRIKKIMQSDEEIGKVAQAVPVIISRTLELFVESLLTKTLRITNSRNAKTLSTSHMKQCIMSEQRFDFLRELVKNVPDISVAEEAANYNEEDGQSSPEDVYPDSDTPYDLSMPSTSGGRNNNRGVAATKANGGQTNYQYKQQYQQPPQNGSGNDSGMTETDLRQRMRQRISGTQSVIMHTASVVQPLKLMRSESSPANAAQHMWHIAPNAATPQQQGQGQQKRLRHQAQSVACSNNNDNCFDSSPPKRQKCEPTTQQTHSQTAIPAPVFSYDLCNKPIVKIDYSNLPLTPAIRGTSEQLNTTAAIGNLSLSAPVRNASFNFSVDAPIINIDLSNIVTTCVESKKTKGNNVPAPAVATISIGALPVELANAGATQPTSTGNIYGKIGADKASSTSTTPPSNQSTDSKTDSNTTTVDSTSSSASSSSCSPSSSFASTSANSQQGGNKAMLKASTDIMAKMTAPRKNALSATCKNSNSCFELDEDYDNI
ncbi:PREDICTED: putative uncharacterized protein DDB_G0277255 [Rhagoletis zephyria]|uniref:putative uncharacterized protein DDB_G0277255 n=1 Tax=Rhagoletis zephyria TaxID=28612 RepID=UPI00081138B8|nr:PREDICTED: putative uncharacterized protein DDB_G0277255 [Rhagoletis zephyria]